MKKITFLLLFMWGAIHLMAQQPSKMYFANISDNIVRVANLDGSDVQTAIGTDPQISFIEGVAIDPIGGHIYVNDGGAGIGIFRFDLDGTNKTTIVSGLSSPDDIALDLVNGKVWWGESGLGAIRRANLDGTNVETIINSGITTIESIAIDIANEKVYWTNTNFEIRSANWDGTNNQQVFQTNDLIKLAKDMNTGLIYFTSFNDGMIFKINPDGTGVEELADFGVTLGAIALDPVVGEVYAAGNNGIYKVGTDGTGAQQVLANPGSNALHLALTFDTTFLPPQREERTEPLPAFSSASLILFGLLAIGTSMLLLGRIKL